MAGRLQREMRLTMRPGTPPTGFPLVPTHPLLRPLAEGPFWGIPCRAEPLAGGIGLLLAPAPQVPILLTERLSAGYGALVLAGWSLFLVWSACGGRLAPPGVRLTLLLWFAGLAATPVALILGSSERLQLDLASNLRDELDRDISSHLRKIDAGSARLDAKFAQVCRTLSARPELGERLEECRAQPGLSRRILDDLWQSCPPEMAVQSMFLVGHGDFCISRHATEVNFEIASSSTWFHQFLAEDLLRSLIRREQNDTPTSGRRHPAPPH